MAQAKEDFWSQYKKVCFENKVVQSRNILKNFVKRTEFSCVVEGIRSEHWKYIFSALSKDNSLTKVHFASCVSPHEDEDELASENIGLKLVPVPASQVECKTELCIGCYSPAAYRGFIPVVDIQAKMKKQCQYFPTPYGRTPKNINNIMTAVDSLLQTSETLTVLKLENLPFRPLDAEQLANGLSKSSTLKCLHLSGCEFEEGSLPIICKSLNASKISWLDLSFCALTHADIEALANVIKAHCLRRRNEMFQKTLRNQVPYLQDMPGLSRISLNSNSLDDKALRILIDSLADDLWIKALDLQNCDIDNTGAIALLNLASTNTSVVIMDLRMNQIDEPLFTRISKQLEQNKAGKDIKCSELPLWKPSELVRKHNNIGKVKTFKKPTAHKFKISKKIAKSHSDKKKRSQLDIFVESIRNERLPKARYESSANERNYPVREGLTEAASQTTADPHDGNELLPVLKNMRHRIQNEMKIRKFLLTKYRQVNLENAQLRQLLKSQNDDIYIDQETFFDVKHTFEKLKVFFDVMKKYGLWEYISMLGFDESTDVVLQENISQKCMKVFRDNTYSAAESPPEFDQEVCCSCRKLDYKHGKMEPPDDGPNSMAETSAKSLHNKIKEDRIDENIAYKVLQDAMNDYNTVSPHQVLNSKPACGRIPDNVYSAYDSVKPSGSKQSGAASSNTTGAQMLIKKFSYSNMPKQLKELVSPADFYNIVKKELERCESEARKPCNPTPIENYESSNLAQINSVQCKQNSHKTAKGRNEASATSAESRGTSTKSQSKISDDEDDIPISVLIARERSKVQCQGKKNAKSSVSSVSNSKVHKNTNHDKIDEAKSLSKSLELLSLLEQSKAANPKSYYTKKGQSTYNASSDEINSSDSNVTASDKASSYSSISSSSSNKSHGKSSDITDASTFGEIESIVDAEVASEASFPIDNLKECKSSADTVTSEAPSSHSSTLKDASKSKSNKSNKSAISGSSSIKESSKKSDKSAKSNVESQGKSKNANKHNKSRPKSNSSKSSSIPSLSDITTVSSKSLKTYSVMKKIPGSDDDQSKGKK